MILIVVGTYVGVCLRGGSAIRIWRLTLPLPSPRLMMAQTVVSVIDWLLAAAVFYVLLPQSRPAFLPFAGAFAAAQLTGLASHVPGGLGVFDGLMVLFLRNQVPIAALATALVAYRIVYYLLPLAVALAMLLMDETSQRRSQLSQFRRTCHALASWATPRVLALFTFASGVVLLFSGATPPYPSACSGWRRSCRCRCWKPRTSPPA